MKFKVGQKVVRVTEWSLNNPRWRGKPVHKGEVHTVRECPTEYCIYLDGITNPLNVHGFEFGYDVTKFEPLIESDQFIEMTYTEILETTPKVSMS